MDFTKMTDAELKELGKALGAEVAKRKEAEKNLATEKLGELLDRVNELQEKYDLEIDCWDIYGNYIKCANTFKLR
jgi:hypothetical protein